MDIQEVKKRKEATTDMLRALLQEFEETCGVSVKGVDLLRETTIGGVTKVAAVELRVELP